MKIEGLGGENGGKMIIRLKTRFILMEKWGKFREMYSKLREILGKGALLEGFFDGVNGVGAFWHSPVCARMLRFCRILKLAGLLFYKNQQNINRPILNSFLSSCLQGRLSLNCT